MKYPMLYLKSLPPLHKAFSKPIVLHFHGVCNCKEKHDYMQYLLKTAHEQMAQQFISSQAVVVNVDSDYFILCKDNLDERMMKRMANEILTLLLERGNQELTFSFGFARAMLDVVGYTIGILNSNKVGDSFLESKTYLCSIGTVQGDAKHYYNYIIKTYEEYQSININ